MMGSTVPAVAGSRKRPCLAAGLAAGLLVLGGCGGSSKSPATQSTGTTPTVSTATQTPQLVVATALDNARTVGATSGGVTAILHAGTHRPKVEVRWPIHFTVTRGGRKAAASVSYEYLFGGQVVARRSHYTFKGRFSDVFKWPSSAVGYPLTFRAVIASGGVTIDLDYPVQVSK
ncbi:MAG: hypothetical protein ABSB69_05320 [Solirubrobacteraceae bacterium]